MSAIGTLLRLPQYARNLARLRQVTAVVVRHGFGHALVRTGLDRYAGFINRSKALTEPNSDLHQLTWEHRVRLVCESLGPTFVKLGQMAATRPDLIPMSLIFELRKLQDSVAPFPFEQVRALIEAELGQTLAEAFATFDEVPIAAASIAQVHGATLKTGERVVVKVQRPQLDRIIHTDLELLHMIAGALEERVPEAAQFRPVDAVEEFARNLKRETDFTNELNNIERYRRVIAGNPHVHLPTTYPHLSTRRVLTMEFIAGAKVTDRAQLEAWGVECKAVAEIGTALFMTSIFEHGFFHGDPHPGNFFVLPDGRLALIDFGMMGSVDRDTIDELLSFMVALLLNDPEMLVTQFIDLGLVEDTVNVRMMQGEISEIIQRYNGVTLAHMDIGLFIAEVFEAVVRYRVRVPVELIIIGKAISTMEGIAQEIYPEFNPLEAIRPYLVQLYVKRVLDPRAHSRRVYRLLHDYLGLARVLPGEVRGILRRIKAGELQLQIRDAGADGRALRNERSINRVLMAIYTVAAWAMFTAVLPAASEAPRWSGMWWWASLLVVQGVFAGTLTLLSFARSREL
ncbi:MAG: ABC1 kinase family protein [Myxococcota bacterium]